MPDKNDVREYDSKVKLEQAERAKRMASVPGYNADRDWKDRAEQRSADRKALARQPSAAAKRKSVQSDTLKRRKRETSNRFSTRSSGR